MRDRVPCHHIVIHQSLTGVTESQDYPGFIRPGRVGHDLVRIDIVRALPEDPESVRFGDRVVERDWPYLELDLDVAAARQLADALIREATAAEEAAEARGIELESVDHAGSRIPGDIDG
jgi:hypothetical protein